MPGSPHTRALSAAVRLALAGTALQGCHTKAPLAPAEHPPPVPQKGEASSTAATGADDPPPKEPPRPTPKECEARLDEYFDEPAEFGARLPAIEDQVVATCCAEALADGHGGKHRWGCCSSPVASSIVVDPELREAASKKLTCTPWGPPTPPSGALGDHAASHRSPHSGRRLDLREQARPARPTLARSPSLDALRSAAIATWRGRMVNEYASARVFEGLAAQLAGVGLGAEARECERFAEQERRHGVQCGAVVEALGAPAIASMGTAESYPTHPDAASELEATVRNCMSETVAVGLISAERLRMPDGSLRRLLSKILAEEVGHARFGWRLLDVLVPRLSPDARVRTEAYIELALTHLVEHELSHLPVDWTPPPEGATYGLCDGHEARRLFSDVVSHAVLPGLRARGLKAARPVNMPNFAA